MSLQRPLSMTEDYSPPPPYTVNVNAAIVTSSAATITNTGQTSLDVLPEVSSIIAERSQAPEAGNSREATPVEEIKYRVLHDYSSTTWQQLSIKKGEVVALVSKCSDSSQWKVRNHDDQQGYVPSSNLERVKEPSVGPHPATQLQPITQSQSSQNTQLAQSSSSTPIVSDKNATPTIETMTLQQKEQQRWAYEYIIPFFMQEFHSATFVTSPGRKSPKFSLMYAYVMFRCNNSFKADYKMFNKFSKYKRTEPSHLWTEWNPLLDNQDHHKDLAAAKRGDLCKVHGGNACYCVGFSNTKYGYGEINLKLNEWAGPEEELLSFLKNSSPKFRRKMEEISKTL